MLHPYIQPCVTRFLLGLILLMVVVVVPYGRASDIHDTTRVTFPRARSTDAGKDDHVTGTKPPDTTRVTYSRYILKLIQFPKTTNGVTSDMLYIFYYLFSIFTLFNAIK